MDQQADKSFLNEKLITTVRTKLKNRDDSWKKIPGLNLSMLEKNVDNRSCFYSLSIALILQGEKEVDVGDCKYSYGSGSMIVTSVEIPTSFRILNASKEKPFYSLSLRLDPILLTKIMEQLNNFPKNNPLEEVKAFCVAKSTPRILDAFYRLLSLQENEEGFNFLLPLILREIYYYALTDAQCKNLRQLCENGMPNNRISKAVEWVKKHYKEPVRVEMLSEISCMATSTFHTHFKNVTSLTPIQYIKRLRLHEAKRLMMFEGFNASSAAFDVGYESVQQFSREYKRLFGKSPKKDIGRA